MPFNNGELAINIMFMALNKPINDLLLLLLIYYEDLIDPEYTWFARVDLVW